MRRITLIRHAKPVFATDDKYCLGSGSDNALSEEGILAAEKLRDTIALLQAENVYASPMRRALHTAEILSGNGDIRTDKRFAELFCGEWDGLSFTQIRERYPELYALRGDNPAYPMPGGETPDEAAARGSAALKDALKNTSGDIAIVAHAGLIRAMLCKITGTDYREIRNFRVDYLAVTALIFDGDTFTVDYVGRDPFSLPDAEKYYRRANTPEHVIRHCEKTAEGAKLLSERLPDGKTDAGLLSACALLHDFMRTEPHHALAGARALAADGYLAAAKIISQHHKISAEGALDEAKLLFLADKLTMENRFVTLDERYRRSAEKHPTPQAADSIRKSRRCADVLAAEFEKESGLSAEALLGCR